MLQTLNTHVVLVLNPDLIYWLQYVAVAHDTSFPRNGDASISAASLAASTASASAAFYTHGAPCSTKSEVEKDRKRIEKG